MVYSTLRHVLVLILFLAVHNAYAQQESMIPDVSEAYLDKLVATAKANYPKVKAYAAREKSAMINVNRARMAWFDIFTFSYLYSPNNSTTIINPTLLNGYQLGLYLNVGSILAKKPSINIAKQEYNIAALERDEYDLNIKALVQQRYYKYIQEKAILRLRSQATLDAENGVKDQKYRYEKGETTMNEYNQALINYSTNAQSKVESEGAVLTAKSSLEELLGTRLEDIN